MGCATLREAPFKVTTTSESPLVHPRLPHDPPNTTATATLRPRIHPRPIRRQAPTGSPLAQTLDLVACAHGWRHGLKSPVACDGFGGLGRAISHRGDRWAVCQQTRLCGLEIAGRDVGGSGRALDTTNAAFAPAERRRPYPLEIQKKEEQKEL